MRFVSLCGRTSALRRSVFALLLCAAACGQAPTTNLDSLDDSEAGLGFNGWSEHIDECGSYKLDGYTPLRTCVVPSARVLDFGHIVYEGEVDITACAARIAAGMKLPYHHDGTVFRNNEGRLPEAQNGHYREYVDPTPGVRGPGPQRIVRGDAHEWYYTPDHYVTFYHVSCSL